ncbi:serine/threonine-protein phosphatase [Couchioplanes caeruleus]|uniref:PP2C family protein-serine/threonine phosphatase n=1 Tax=Couchioplanes caeruleus TaxID=56438 RepID=UPI0020C09076|nr:PP2C family protein-serine/threonine phosphatase [Couchioplanes caeruleus]UQU61668.1 serine/threonine-protein phosphatase [Couchioplanes caeruleus]
MAHEDASWHGLVREILDRSHLWRPEDLAGVVDGAAGRLGLRTTIYVIDHEQRFLRPLGVPGRDLPEPLAVDGTEGGAAFIGVESVPAGDRLWSPMVNGTDRLGVVEYRLPAGAAEPDRHLVRECELVAGLVGHLITTTQPRGDLLRLAQRSRPMTPGAELLWELLPPLTVSVGDFAVAAVLEPAYDVGGDAFDYVADDRRPQFVVLDAAGRRLRAGLAAAVVLSSIRAARRAGGDLLEQARAADAELLQQFPDARFATAVLAELDLDKGVLRYVNAGHPPPLVMRDGKVVETLTEGRRMPLGIPDPQAAYGEVTLHPGDRLVLYTDGVTEARDAAGEQFGVRRLADLVEHHCADDAPLSESLRRLSHAVLDHQDGPPADDLTLVLVEWSAGAALRTVPPTSRESATAG